MKNWQVILQEYNARGSMTMKEFCASKVISKNSIHRYQAKAKKLAQQASKPSSSTSSATSSKLAALKGKRSMGVIAASKPKALAAADKGSSSASLSQSAIDVSSEARVRATFKAMPEVSAGASMSVDLSSAMSTLASAVEAVRRENEMLRGAVQRLEQEKAAIYSTLEKFAASLSVQKV
jgi:hypothetical protein